MSQAADSADSGTTGEPAIAAGHLSQAEREALLQGFRDWLGTPSATVGTPPPEPPRVDWPALLQQFTALRQEVNLQTKASRTANEQFAEALKVLSTPKVDPDAAIRPLLKVVIELSDALQNANQQLERTQQHVEDWLDSWIDDPDSPWPDPPDFPVSSAEPAAAPSWLGRLFASPKPVPSGLPAEWLAWAEQVQDWKAEQDARCEELRLRGPELLRGIADGYALSLRRLERTWPTLELEPIDCVGERFDPEIMEAVELVEGSPSGYVMEEVRAGYRWKGQLFRAALVKVSR